MCQRLAGKGARGGGAARGWAGLGRRLRGAALLAAGPVADHRDRVPGRSPGNFGFLPGQFVQFLKRRFVGRIECLHLAADDQRVLRTFADALASAIRCLAVKSANGLKASGLGAAAFAETSFKASFKSFDILILLYRASPV